MNIPHIPQILALSCVATMACAQPGRGAINAPSAPIYIGAISSLTAGPDFASPGMAARAVFDSVNLSGGIQKRKLVFVQEDDQGNPGVAAAAAARLIDGVKVVAMAGGVSFLECSVNGRAYQVAGLASLPALGLDNNCFNTPMIAPVNTGPYMQLALAMHYVADKLRKKRFCVLRLGTPANVQKALDGVVQEWSDKTGNRPVLDERDIKPTDSPEPYFKKANEAGCEAIVFGGTEDFSVRFARAGKKMMADNIPLVFQGAIYTSQAAERLGREGNGIYTLSEFEPWSSRSGQLSHWRSLMTANNIPLTSSAQGGYVAAQVLVKAMLSIRGEITRESVTRALQQMRPDEIPMLGMPFSFGDDKAHHPNQAAIPMQLIDGRWRIAHHEWLKPFYPGTAK